MLHGDDCHDAAVARLTTVLIYAMCGQRQGFNADAEVQ